MKICRDKQRNIISILFVRNKSDISRTRHPRFSFTCRILMQFNIRDAHFTNQSSILRWLCEQRHVFPLVRQPCGAISRIRERGNIGAISAYTNSHRVDLHTYRRFGSAAWLELCNVVHVCRERIYAILSDVPGATLFRTSNLEIYGIPDSALLTHRHSRRAFQYASRRT